VRKVRWLIAFALVGLFVPAFAADEAPKGEKLEWKFELDKTFYQKMETETVQTMKVMGSDIKQTQTQTFFFSWKPVKKNDDGSWDIKQKIDAIVMKIEIGGQPITYDSRKKEGGTTALGDFFKQLVDSEFTLTVSKDFKVTKITGRDDFLKKLTSANPQMDALLKQILSEESLKEMADPTFAAIPNKEVKKGDTWKKESTLDMGPIGKYTNTYDYTYDGPNDKKLEQIKVATTLKYTAPDNTAVGGGLPFKIKSATLTSKNAGGTILFNKEKGRVESSEMKVDLDGDLNIEIGGQTTAVNLKQTQKTTVTTDDKDLSK